PQPTEEERIARGQIPVALAHAVEPVELRPHRVREHHLLGRGLLRRALEDAQGDVPTRAPALVEDVADVEREQLVLAEPRRGREADDDVVTEPVAVLAGGLEHGGELLVSHGAGGTGDGLGVAGHGASRRWRTDPYRLPPRPQARPIATRGKPA